MNKISKFLLKLSRAERERIGPVIDMIVAKDLSGLDCKKLKDRGNKYRVRIGGIRILFEKAEPENIITDIGFRDDNTY